MLDAADHDLLLDGLNVSPVDIGASELFLQVIDPQGHDGQPIDCAARCLGVQLSVFGRLDTSLIQCVGDPVVHFFDPVVPLLIQAVDRTFDPRDFLVTDIRAAGNVLFVPQQEVEAALLAGNAQETFERVVDFTMVPAI